MKNVWTFGSGLYLFSYYTYSSINIIHTMIVDTRHTVNVILIVILVLHTIILIVIRHTHSHTIVKTKVNYN